MAIEELGRAGGLVLAQHVGRRFPGVLIQGDTLFSLYEDLAEEASDSYTLERVREWLGGYERALDELGLDLPYPNAGRVTPQQMLMSVGDQRLRASLRERTGRLAGMVALGRHLDAMDQAIPLACDLIVAGIEPQSVVAVAQLPPGSTWRDGRDAVVTMLASLSYTVEEPLNPETSGRYSSERSRTGNSHPSTSLGHSYSVCQALTPSPSSTVSFFCCSTNSTMRPKRFDARQSWSACVGWCAHTRPSVGGREHAGALRSPTRRHGSGQSRRRVASQRRLVGTA